MSSNPYNLPDLPPPGQTVGVPLQTLLDMDTRDNVQEQLETLVEGGMTPSYDDGYAHLTNEILGADTEQD